MIERLWKYWRRFIRATGGRKVYAVLLVMLTVTITLALVVYFSERGHNQHIHGVWSGFYWMMVTIAAGPPWDAETAPGRVAYYTISVVRPGLFALLTAGIASELVQLVSRRNAGKGRTKLKDHIVICGWSSKGTEIIQEVRDRDDEERTREVVVLAPLAENPSRDELTTFISGNPTSAEDLRRAGIETAKTAIILADNSIPDVDVEDMDSRTLLAALAVESTNPDCYTCVEIIHSGNREHFERTRANELLVSGKLTGALLAHSAVTHGLSQIVDELISFPEGNEFYWINVPDVLVGKQFHEALSKLKTEFEAVPIALSVHANNGKSQTNPPSAAILQKGDRLLVIAEKKPFL
jgi:voltage-gated potassium channel